MATFHVTVKVETPEGINKTYPLTIENVCDEFDAQILAELKAYKMGDDVIEFIKVEKLELAQ